MLVSLLTGFQYDMLIYLKLVYLTKDCEKSIIFIHTIQYVLKCLNYPNIKQLKLSLSRCYFTCSTGFLNVVQCSLNHLNHHIHSGNISGVTVTVLKTGNKLQLGVRGIYHIPIPLYRKTTERYTYKLHSKPSVCVHVCGDHNFENPLQTIP